MQKTKKLSHFYLYSILISIFIVGIYLFIKNNNFAQVSSINEIAPPSSSKLGLSACSGVTSVDLVECIYNECPPIPYCPKDQVCNQQIPQCIQKPGLCRQNICVPLDQAEKNIVLESQNTKAYLSQPVEIELLAQSTNNSFSLSGVELNLEYDLSAIDIQDIKPTTYMPIVLKATYSTSLGKSTTFGAPIESGGRTISGVVAKIKVLPKKLGYNTIVLDHSVATNTQFSGNALHNANPITITVYNQGDLNTDKIIDLFDYNMLIKDFGTKYNLFDYNNLITNYSQKSP